MELEPKMHIPFLVLEQKCDPVKLPHPARSFLIQKMCLVLPEGRELRKHRPAAGGGPCEAAGGRGALLATVTPAPNCLLAPGAVCRGKCCSRAEFDDGKVTVVMQRVTWLSSRLMSVCVFVTVRNQLHS